MVLHAKVNFVQVVSPVLFIFTSESDMFETVPEIAKLTSLKKIMLCYSGHSS